MQYIQRPLKLRWLALSLSFFLYLHIAIVIYTLALSYIVWLYSGQKYKA